MKLKRTEHKKIIFLLLIIFSAAWLLSLFWETAQRYPAAIENQSFFDFIKPEDSLNVALEKEIMDSIKIQKIEKQFQIDVRNFFVKSSNQHLCEIYNEFTLTFEAEGIATSGERPSMTITSPCEVSSRTNLPIPVRIPVADIFKLKPTDTNISFQINPRVNFSFKNVSDVWPEYWVLSNVQFQNSTLQNEIVINRREIYKLSSKPLIMEWQ